MVFRFGALTIKFLFVAYLLVYTKLVFGMDDNTEPPFGATLDKLIFELDLDALLEGGYVGPEISLENFSNEKSEWKGAFVFCNQKGCTTSLFSAEPSKIKTALRQHIYNKHKEDFRKMVQKYVQGNFRGGIKPSVQCWSCPKVLTTCNRFLAESVLCKSLMSHIGTVHDETLNDELDRYLETSKNIIKAADYYKRH